MKRVILYIVLGALVVAGLVAAFRPLRQRAGQVATYLRVMSGDTGDVMSSANYQRFASRREAVLAMKAALLDVARVESLAVANSGRPVTTFLATDVTFDPNKVSVWISLWRDRWVAAAASNRFNSTMTCMITAMLDTVTSRYQPGAPVCAEAWFPESIAVMPRPRPK